MKISDVVNQESKSEWLGLILLVIEFLHQGLVHERALVVACALEPIHDVLNGLVNGVLVEVESREVVDGATLVKVGSVNEVPSRLPWAALGLDLVGECRALNEGISTFRCDHLGMRVGINTQELFGLFKCGLSRLSERELVLSDTRHKEVAILPESRGLACKEQNSH